MSIRLAAFLVVLTCMVYTPANAYDPRDGDICLGLTCPITSAGTTTMDGDRKSLIACIFVNGLGTQPYWRSMTPVFRTPDGKVGIGAQFDTYAQSPQSKLDAAGEVKVASTGVACSAANAGAIRFVTATKKFEGCDGTSWAALGGSSTTTSTTPPVCSTQEIWVYNGQQIICPSGSLSGTPVISGMSDTGNYWSITCCH